MKYKILLKSDNGFYSYAKDKAEQTDTITDINGNEIQVGTGKYQIVDFETEDVDKVKAKYVELLDKHFKDSLDIVADVNEIVNFSVDVEEVKPINAESSQDKPSDNSCHCPSNDIANGDSIKDIFDNNGTEEVEDTTPENSEVNPSIPID